MNIIMTKTHAMLCKREMPRPIVMVVSNEFLKICPLTNHAYIEITRKAISNDLSDEKVVIVIRLENMAIIACTPRVPEHT